MYSRGTNNLNANQFRDDRLNVYNLNTRTATSYPVNDEIQDQNTSYLNNSNLNYSNNNTSNYVNDAYNVSSVDNQIYFEKQDGATILQDCFDLSFVCDAVNL